MIAHNHTNSQYKLLLSIVLIRREVRLRGKSWFLCRGKDYDTCSPSPRRYNKDRRELLMINPTSLIVLTLHGYCQAIVRLLSLHGLSPLSHTIEDSRSCRTPLTTNTSDELITPSWHKLLPSIFLTTRHKHEFDWWKFGEYLCVRMFSVCSCDKWCRF